MFLSGIPSRRGRVTWEWDKHSQWWRSLVRGVGQVGCGNKKDFWSSPECWRCWESKEHSRRVGRWAPLINDHDNHHQFFIIIITHTSSSIREDILTRNQISFGHCPNSGNLDVKISLLSKNVSILGTIILWKKSKKIGHGYPPPPESNLTFCKDVFPNTNCSSVVYWREQSLWDSTDSKVSNRDYYDDYDKGSLQKKKLVKVGLLDQAADPPPPRKLGQKNGKKFQCLFCIFAYSEHFKLFMKMYHFW